MDNAAQEPKIHSYFRTMEKHDASDMHIKADSPPIFRIGKHIRRTKTEPLTAEKIKDLIFAILSEKQIAEFEKSGNLDFGYALEGSGRFRLNIFRQRGSISIATRRINSKVPGFEELHLPSVTAEIAEYEQGMVLVVGATGSGKSTTLAAMIQHINETRSCHIITVEDPIEYSYTDDKAFINQREIGVDVGSFGTALKYVVREDPDVILLGEMRDGETVEVGLTAADTGHLVFGTLHSSGAAQSIGRMLDLFPTEKHNQIRQLLFFNLRAVICQKLLPGAKPESPIVPAVEVMICSPEVKKIIQDGNDDRLSAAIRAGKEAKMQDFNAALLSLINAGMLSEEVALQNSPNPEGLKMNLKGIFLSEDTGIV